MKDLKERTIRGGFAKVCAQIANFVLRLGSLMILARLLDPASFGIVGMATAVVGVLQLFKDFGLSTAAVQHATVTENQHSTLFWINLLVGALLMCIAVAAAPIIAALYREPRLFWVTIVLATGFLFNAAGVQHLALLQREMRFTAIAAIETISLVTSTLLGIVVALGGFGFWALVVTAITNPLVSTVCMWLITGWIPGPPRKKAGTRSMLRFGGTITLNGIIAYVAFNLEKVLLGRFWGADAIGMYGRAYQLINIPTGNLNSAVGEVAFSALSRVRDDPKRFRRLFIKGYSLVLTLTIPITFVCTLFASDVVRVVLGPQWIAATPILRLLAPTIFIFSVIFPLGWLLYSLGLVGRSLRIALVFAPIMIAGYILALPYGPEGVAFAYSAVMTLWVVPHVLWCLHGTVVRPRDIALAVSRPLGASLAAGALALGVRFLCGESMSVVARLLIESTSLVLGYCSILFFATGQKSFYLELVRELRSSSGKVSSLVSASQTIEQRTI